MASNVLNFAILFFYLKNHKKNSLCGIGEPYTKKDYSAVGGIEGVALPSNMPFNWCNF